MYIGMNDKDLHKQVLDKAVFFAAIARELESVTIFEAIGYYKGERENSLKLEIFGMSHEELVTIARKLCIDLNQECIIVDGEFVNHPAAA
jgi:hypothetical protein